MCYSIEQYFIDFIDFIITEVLFDQNELIQTKIFFFKYYTIQ